MKKGIIIVVLLHLVVFCFGQGGLFEWVYQKKSGINHSISYSLEYYNSSWYVFGLSGSCHSAFVSKLNNDGTVDWQKFGNGGYSTYTASAVANNRIYACGWDLLVDDILNDAENGFVDVVDSAGGINRIIADTNYAAGFNLIAAAGDRIIVSASKYSSTPYQYLVMYDTSGALLWEYQVGDSIKGLAFHGNRVITHTTSSIYTLDNQGGLISTYQLLSNQIDMCTFTDSLLAVAGKQQILIFDSTLAVIDTIQLNQQFDRVSKISGDVNGNLAVMGYKGDSLNVAMFDAQRSRQTYFSTDLGCLEVVDLAFNDSIVAIAGTEWRGDYPFRLGSKFLKTYDYNGTTVSSNAVVVIDTIKTFIDSSEYYTYVQVGPDSFQSVYNLYLSQDIIFRNTGSDTVHSFYCHTKYLNGMNCGWYYEYKYFDSLKLAPRDTLVYSYANRLELSQRSGWNVPGGVGYIRAVNESIDENNCDGSGFRFRTRIFLDIEEQEVLSNLQFYPNPFTSTITISGIDENNTITIYNTAGKQVYTTTTARSIQIDLSILASGIYYVAVVDEHTGKSYTKKLVKR